MKSLVKKFKDLSKNNTNIAGGKGASLGEMLNAGIPVPDGFVVIAQTFDFFTKETDLVQEIESILSTVNTDAIHTVESTSEQIQALITSAVMPDEIKTEVLAAFDKLGSELVAVRSSATAEDGADHAWAGQLESYMNIGRDRLVHHVKECWASLFTPRAIFYRFEKGLHTSHISVAVVVQKMVNSEKSGIAFSVHPVTEDHNQMIIEAGFGFGDAIVSGSVTPDAYVVTKEPKEIIDLNLNTQTRKLRRRIKDENPDPDWGENVWEELSEQEGNQQVLSEAEIKELSDIIIKIESHYNRPMDIEWAWEHGKFYVTQARPVTTLSSQDKPSTLSKRVVLSRWFTREMSLMQAQLWNISETTQGADWIGFDFKHQVFRRDRYGLFSVWYNDVEGEEYLSTYREHVKKHGDKYVSKLQRDFLKSVEQLEKFITDNTATSYSDLIALAGQYYYCLPRVFDLVDLEGIDPAVNDTALGLRSRSQHLSYQIDRKLESLIASDRPDLFPYALDLSISFLSDLDQKPQLQYKPRTPYAVKDGEIHYTNQEIMTDYILREQSSDHDPRTLIGLVASRGNTQGDVCRVLTSKDVNKFEEGKVMVVYNTNPDYVVAMKKATAIIAEEGGLTSHTAIVARELGVPALVGVKSAVALLSDGMRVDINTDSGTITILENKVSGT